MRTFVESLRRLYVQGRVTKKKIDGYLANGKINEEEYKYILGLN